MIKTKTQVKLNIPGLRQASTIIDRELLRASDNIGKDGIKRIRRIQRRATGEEQKRTKYRIISRKNFSNVEFYNSVIQAAVDETGAIPHFPPYKAGSSLYQWVSRKGFSPAPSKSSRIAAGRAGRSQARQAGLTGDDIKVSGRIAANKASANRVKQIESIAFLIARAISRRGLPRPGDRLRKPFETAKPGIASYSLAEVARATARAVARINK